MSSRLHDTRTTRRAGAHGKPCEPLPHWERRLALFMASPDGTPWPLQWVRAGRQMVCICCAAHVESTVERRGATQPVACKLHAEAVRAEVAKLTAEHGDNDWHLHNRWRP